MNDLAAVLQHLRPGAAWALEGVSPGDSMADQYAALDWRQGDTPPTLAECEAEVLGLAVTEAKREIDAAAEVARLRFITAGSGQAMVYERKGQEADAAAADPSPAAADYPLLAAEVGITAPDTGDEAVDIAAVASAVLAQRDLWVPVAAAIEATRLSAKQAVDAAADEAAIQAVLDGLAWPAPS